LTGTDKFSDVDGNDPCIVVEAAKEAIRAKVARRPNVMLMGPATLAALVVHQKIIAKFQYVSVSVLTLEHIKQAFQMDNIIVGEAVKFTDAGVGADVWGDYLILAYQGSGASAFEPSFGYTFRKRGMPTAGTWNSPDGKIKYYQYTDIWGQKIVGGDAGYLFTDCV